jgi:Tol biopolymer transport system component
MELKGQAVPVAEQMADNAIGTNSHAAFSASANDVMVFWRGSATRDRQLTWYDRQGKVLGTAGEPGDYRWLALSPDGTHAALSTRNGQASNIWLLDLSRGTRWRFTFGSATDLGPVWSPDGTRIIFSSGHELYQRPASGVKDAEVLLTYSEEPHATSWSRDGRFLLFEVLHPKTKWDIWVLPLEGAKKPVPFLVTDFAEGDAHFSPDGRWVAYASDESGHLEIYVRSFAMNSARTAVESGGKWQISNGYGVEPCWRGDGRELYYRSQDGRIMAVEMGANPEFRIGKPEPLGFAAGVAASAVWDAMPDGRRFLVAAPKSNGPEPYTVIVNWQNALKK